MRMSDAVEYYFPESRNHFRYIDLGVPVEIIPDIDTSICEHCGGKEGVEAEPARTRYFWDGWGENPNRDHYLCRICAEDHHAYCQSPFYEGSDP